MGVVIRPSTSSRVRPASDSAAVATTPLVLAGFSFGAWIQTRVAQALGQQAVPGLQLQGMVLVGLAAGEVPAGRAYDPAEVRPLEPPILDAPCIPADRLPLAAWLWAAEGDPAGTGPARALRRAVSNENARAVRARLSTATP